MIYLKNNTEIQTIYIPRQTVLGGGYIATTKTYEDGYRDGLEDGKKQQKDKLLNLYVTANGQYEREDGWDVVTVDTPDCSDAYNKGYEDGYNQGQAECPDCPEGGSCNLGEGEFVFGTGDVGRYELNASDDGYDGWSKIYLEIEGGAIKVHRASELLDSFNNNNGAGLDYGAYYYVGGEITEIREVNTQYGNATYILDNGFKIYRGKWIDGNGFSSEDQIKVGAYIVVYGVLAEYKGTLQLSKNSQVIAYQECTGGEIISCNLEDKSVTPSMSDRDGNNLIVVEESEGYDGLSRVVIDPQTIYNEGVEEGRNQGGGGCNLEDKIVEPTVEDVDESGLMYVNPSEGYNGMSRTVVNTSSLRNSWYNEGLEAGRAEGGEGGSANLINPIIFTETEGNTINAESVQIPTFAYEGNQYYNVGVLNMPDYEEFKIQIRFQPTNGGYGEPINIFGCENTDWDSTTFGARIYEGQIYFRMSGQDVASPYTENAWYDVEMGYNATKRWVIVNGEILLEADHTSFNKPSQSLMIGAINSGGNAFRPFYGKIAATYLEANGNQVWLLPKDEGYMDVYWNDKGLPWIQISGENNARFENEYMSGDGMKSITWLGKRVDTTPSTIGGIKFGNSTFEECTFNLEGIEDFSYLFENCKNLRTAPSIQKPIRNTRSMFSSCISLTTAPTYNTSEATDLGGMYAGCHNLTSVGSVDCSSLPNAPIGWNREAYIFDTNQYPSLTDFGGFIGLKQAVDLSGLIALSNNSVENIFNNLYDFSGNGETPNSIQGNITMSSFITDAVEQYRSTAESKGWTITIK